MTYGKVLTFPCIHLLKETLLKTSYSDNANSIHFTGQHFIFMLLVTWKPHKGNPLSEAIISLEKKEFLNITRIHFCELF